MTDPAEPQPSPADRPIAALGLAPLLQVFDLAQSLVFYRDLLGFEVIQKDQPGELADWALLRLDRAELMLNTAYEKSNRPTRPDPTRVAAHADTAIYLGCPDIDAAYQRLRARGVDINPPMITSYGFLALHLTDPDGYAVVFHWPSADPNSGG